MSIVNKIGQKPVSILVVEDDPGDFGLIQAYANLYGLGISGREEHLTWAKTLTEGIAVSKNIKPDIVLLDLSLPDSDKLDTVLAMYAILPNVPIIVVTGYNDNALSAAALQAGAQDYLIKEQLDYYAISNAVRRALVH